MNGEAKKRKWNWARYEELNQNIYIVIMFYALHREVCVRFFVLRRTDHIPIWICFPWIWSCKPSEYRYAMAYDGVCLQSMFPLKISRQNWMEYVMILLMWILRKKERQSMRVLERRSIREREWMAVNEQWCWWILTVIWWTFDYYPYSNRSPCCAWQVE